MNYHIYYINNYPFGRSPHSEFRKKGITICYEKGFGRAILHSRMLCEPYEVVQHVEYVHVGAAAHSTCPVHVGWRYRVRTDEIYP